MIALERLNICIGTHWESTVDMAGPGWQTQTECRHLQAQHGSCKQHS